ncbi:amino acid ABC transporter permease [Meridianimarinicoccus aquatilis]|uniref:Amino acid ABC transporter permease n=1 Tax=Meridianimarinicoccus aquatilis TaxID=2552766 RepID=A0A4R6AQ59_9RHOB|nr:amino acid ABC transporter permease [Fluviibacterium aquatile]TDL83813.1 amino acid ABC transporter permease [Fluviibacterium aquatile]
MKDLFVSIFGAPEGIVLLQLLTATQFTIYLSLIAFIGGGTVGAGITLLRVLPSKIARRSATGYIWLFQSAPLLMLLFLFGLGVPRLIGVNVNVWLAASAALTLYTSAYLAEVWRSAIDSIPNGQWEGASSLGLRFGHTLRHVILPQAMRISLAPTVGFLVQIIKGTSLAYIIGFSDLMSVGKRWANAPVEGTEPFIIYPLMALIYFALCFPLSRLSLVLEKRLGTVKKTPLVAA